MLFQALAARRESMHNLLVATRPAARPQLTGLVARHPRGPQAGAGPASTTWSTVLNKNQDNLDNSLRLMAPFYRVFANTLGTGPWFDTYIQNLPPAPDVAGRRWRLVSSADRRRQALRRPGPRIVALVVGRRRCGCSPAATTARSCVARTSPGRSRSTRAATSGSSASPRRQGRQGHAVAAPRSWSR